MDIKQLIKQELFMRFSGIWKNTLNKFSICLMITIINQIKSSIDSRKLKNLFYYFKW